MKKIKINGADIYMDGGSYGFWFDFNGIVEYEFFIERDLSKESKNGYLPPIICREYYNKNNTIIQLSWAEAQTFLSTINYEDKHFKKLKEIVNSNGEFTE